MPKLHQTLMGKKFFEGDFPKLVKAINRVGDILEREEKEKERKEEKKNWLIGKKVRANDETSYEGLVGLITDVKIGKEKETNNDGDDIYVSFVHEEDRVEEIEEIGGFDEVIMDITMLEFLRKNEKGRKNISLDEILIKYFGSGFKNEGDTTCKSYETLTSLLYDLEKLGVISSVKVNETIDFLDEITGDI